MNLVPGDLSGDERWWELQIYVLSMRVIKSYLPAHLGPGPVLLLLLVLAEDAVPPWGNWPSSINNFRQTGHVPCCKERCDAW